MNWGNLKGVPGIETEDNRPAQALDIVPEPHRIYDEIRVTQGPPSEDFPLEDSLSSPETPARTGDGENSMEEDELPRLDEPPLRMEDDDNAPDDGSRMQLD